MHTYISAIAVFLGVADNDFIGGISLVEVSI